jgi:hypothetical protein
MMTFGDWLLAQQNRADWIGDLARHAARDRGFPRSGAPGDIRRRVLGQAWDEDTLGALDDALTEWRTLRARMDRGGVAHFGASATSILSSRDSARPIAFSA